MTIRLSEGERFGRLTVLAEDEPIRVRVGGLKGSVVPKRRFRCSCDCGVTRVYLFADLRAGKSRSCGCARVEKCQVHADCGSPEYQAWKDMKARCKNPRLRAFKDYGGRGISVCQRWIESYESFLADMGRRPTPQHSIDRRDNDGNYEPDNCRWATKSEQNANRRRLKKQKK